MAAAGVDPGGPSGLGGWLVLPAIGLCLTPLRLLSLLGAEYVPIFENGAWENLTTPGTGAYHYLWGPLIVYEIVGNLSFAIAAVILIVLFFRETTGFPPS